MSSLQCDNPKPSRLYVGYINQSVGMSTSDIMCSTTLICICHLLFSLTLLLPLCLLSLSDSTSYRCFSYLTISLFVFLVCTFLHASFPLSLCLYFVSAHPESHFKNACTTNKQKKKTASLDFYWPSLGKITVAMPHTI